MLAAGMANGARAGKLAELLGVGLTTLQRWRRQFAGDEDGLDRRKGSPRLVSHRLTQEERQRILLTCNQPEFTALPPGQIVPILADRGFYNSFGEDCVFGSERSSCLVLHADMVRRTGGGQGLLEVCPNSPRLGAAPTVTCAGTALAPWPPSSPTTQSLQAI
jgi:hypothetical protein